MYEAPYGKSRRTLDFARWYVCTTCTHAFKEGDGGKVGGRPYCSRYGCLSEAISLKRRGFKQAGSGGGAAAGQINMVTEDGDLMVTDELDEMIIA